MKTYAVLTAAASLWGITGLSHAGTIASPALPTLHSTTFVGGELIETGGACYIRNVDTDDSISVEVKFFQNFGVELAPDFQNCNNAPLGPGKTCVLIISNLPDDVVFACSAKATGSVKKLRGILELRGHTASGLKVILSEELR
jgi:hypothetical protein